MCVGEQFGTCYSAIDFLDDARKSLKRGQYQKSLDRLEQAEKEIQKQKADLRKYLEKELIHKKDRFQESRENIARLKKLNCYLQVIENGANAEAGKIKQTLQARLREQEEFLTDYEIDIEVVFFLREDDPDYSEDDDSILVTLHCCDHIGFENTDGNYDHNTVGGLLPFRHCALFHALYDHISPDLHWSDLLRIGSAWANIKVEYQKKYDLAAGELQRDNWIGADESLHYKLLDRRMQQEQ